MMKALAISLLIGASSAASPFQHVMKPTKQDPSNQANQLYNFQDSFKALTSQARAAWDEVSTLFPEALKQANTLPPPKAHTRRPDSYWDHITKGAEFQNSWVVTQGENQASDVEEDLNTYNLRSKKNDPAVLGVDPGVTQYSGYLDDEENDKHLFYWFFESRNDPENDPVVLWLNGGPGCSSLTGLFVELGPSSIDENIHTVFNPYSWNSNASIIFLDQPVNTGYSYSGRSVRSTVAASKDVYALLTLFFEQFPQYSHQAFHIAGESYAGHYIPVFASEILRHKHRNINLQSILIGNGLTDGMTQYAYFRPMACGDGGWPAVLDQGSCRGMENALSRCQSLIKGCYESESLWSCVPASIYCNNVMIGPYQRTGTNVYDIREPCKDPENLCYPELGLIAQYLNRKEVKEAVGAEVDGYSACNFDVNRNFLLNGDWMKPYHRLVPGILEQIPVLVYAGDADFICNWLGNYAWTEALDWAGKAAYNQVEMTALRLGGEGEKYGEMKSSGNLTFMRIHAAGHMVPHDQPEGGLDFFNRWLHGEWVGGERS